MSPSKHILFLTPGFPKDENDFICIPPLQEYLKKLQIIYPNLKISVLAFQYPYSKKIYSWNGMIIIPMGGKNYKLKKFLLWLQAIGKAKNIHQETPIDVIHSLWLGECTFIGNILAKKFKCKHVSTLMGQDVKSSNKYLKLLKNSRAKIIALSKNQADEFFRLTKRETDEIIHWGIDDQKFDVTHRDIDLLAAGSLIPLKYYSLFIKVVEIAAQKYPDIKCVLAGTGPEHSKLKMQARKAGVEKNLEFKGLISRTDIFKLMQRSKIFVHPSLFEGSGFVFAEALVNGMNIVSFNVGYAQTHPKWFIAKDDTDLINKTLDLLSTALNFNPINIFPINETVNKYASLYGVN